MSLIKFYSKVYDQEIVCYNNEHISNFIIQNQLWEENICNIIANNLENDKEFIDIGANIGLISLGVHKIALKKGKNLNHIHCFECDPTHLNLLTSNLNFLSDNFVSIYPFALADKIKLCLMSVNPDNRGCNFIYNSVDDNTISNYTYPFIPEYNQYNKKNYILSLPLDQIKYKFKNVGVIKIDVEGFEYFVLLGAHNIIFEYKPIILIEIWDINKDKVFELLKKYNYKIEYIEDQNYICKYMPVM
jgi:FkbM family methyltransferase